MSPLIIWCACMKLPQIYISVQKFNCCSKVKNADEDTPQSAEEVAAGGAFVVREEAREDLEQEAEIARRP
jgi:hypothetical protein